jgi:putative SOS response-associated peptidase YedK
MPLILRPSDHVRWLRADWKEAQQLVRPLPSAAIVAQTDSGG